MKVIVVALSMLLATSLAFAAKKKVQNSSDDSDSSYSVSSDESTSRTSVRQRETNPNAVLRAVTPQVGLVISDINYPQTSTKTGLLVGAALDLFKAGNLTLETGLQYKQEGTTFTQGGAILHMNYLVVPVAAKYFFNGERTNGFYGKAGLTPGINVAHSISDASGNNSVDIPGSNTFDLGVIVGAGGKFALSSEMSLVMEANYTRGLTNIIDSTQTFGGQQPIGPINNSAFGFLTGVAFNM